MTEPEIVDQLSRRRAEAAEAWDLTDEFVLIGSGDLIPVPGRYDRAYPFRSHSEYLYLTDRERPGGVLAFDPAEGWIDFVAPVTAQERLWSATDDPRAFAPEEILDVGRLDAWVAARSGRRCACLGTPSQRFPSDPQFAEGLRYALTHVRRCKDLVEA